MSTAIARTQVGESNDMPCNGGNAADVAVDATTHGRGHTDGEGVLLRDKGGERADDGGRVDGKGETQGV